MDDNAHRIITTDLATSSTFHLHFTFHHFLGCGSDGQVRAFLHRPTGHIIAVKTPRPDRFWTSEDIREEAIALRTIGSHGTHKNIAQMLAYQPDFGPTSCPAIFSPCADFGNLLAYRAAWRNQEAQCGAPYGIREATVWKLFKDIVMALDFLHNKCGAIHRDVKSENILVMRSPRYRGSLIPSVPVFKLCDFSRAVAYPSVDGKLRSWAGTVNYAPPLCERLDRDPARPAGDMWSLGATIQEFAIGVSPIKSRKKLISFMDQVGMPHPRPDEEVLWAMPEWRKKFSAVHRPLNVSASLLHCFDVSMPISRSYMPFSDKLEHWYKKLFIVDHELRATSAQLAEELAPFINGYIVAGVDKASQKRKYDSVTKASSKAAVLAPSPIEGRHRGGVAAPVRHTQGQNLAPSYEGNDYPPWS